MGVAAAGVPDPWAGIVSCWPIRMNARWSSPFACTIAGTLLPYVRAMAETVSPPRTVWLRAAGADGAGEADVPPAEDEPADGIRSTCPA
ncbi:hypothetical protein GCM10023113_13460 [Cellulomonas oligotrophica]|uniref:Uncharacterized protein n=1 Tax=Cellulomonas oligotrophica TaxID=931536 RepID=A0ABQ4D8J9_9CELL|nr:hypothetical protein Col01nite_11930 [Cellulomonas oligotrophica]